MSCLLVNHVLFFNIFSVFSMDCYLKKKKNSRAHVFPEVGIEVWEKRLVLSAGPARAVELEAVQLQLPLFTCHPEVEHN